MSSTADNSFLSLVVSDQDLDDLKCSVCHDLFDSARVAALSDPCDKHPWMDHCCRRCQPCMHTFCYNCLAIILRNERRCPLCRQVWKTVGTLLDQNMERRMAELIVKCKNQSCEWQGKLGFMRENYKMHQGVCPFAIHECLDCKNSMLRSCRDEHNLICPDKIIECECKITGKRSWVHEHHVKECPLRLEVCAFCQESVPFSSMMYHHSEKCTQMFIRCSFSPCPVFLRRIDTTAHQKECPFVPVECEQCHMLVPKQLLNDDHLCPKAEMECECKSIIIREDLIKHQESCPKTMVNCDFHAHGCEWKGMRSDLKCHLNENVGVHLSYTLLKPKPKQAESFSYAELVVSSNERIPVCVFNEGKEPNTKWVRCLLGNEERFQVPIEQISWSTNGYLSILINKHQLTLEYTKYCITESRSYLPNDLVDYNIDRDGYGWVLGKILRFGSLDSFKYFDSCEVQLIGFDAKTCPYTIIRHVTIDKLAPAWSRSNGQIGPCEETAPLSIEQLSSNGKKFWKQKLYMDGQTNDIQK